MEYLLQKAFESASQKYTPEQVSAILDKHQEALIAIQNCFGMLYGWGLVWTLCIVMLIVLAIRSEINYRQLRKQMISKELWVRNHRLVEHDDPDIREIV